MNSPVGLVAIFAWPLVALAMFGAMPARRAMLASLVTGYLFLPIVSYDLPGLPSYSKFTAITAGAVLGVLLFDLHAVLRLRLSIVDGFVLLLVASPFFASTTNDLGAYDGLSSSVQSFIQYGSAWFLGRIYLGDPTGVREFVVATLIGALVYVPLCLFEIRFSPQLHRWLYGFHQHQFAQTMRFGGYRPMVFMQHGLQVGMWMASATIAGFWLWKTRAVQTVAGLSIAYAAIAVAVTGVLCKSLGALALTVVGSMALFASQRLRTRLIVFAIACVPPTYITVRALDLWSGESLVDFIANNVSADRAESLYGRLWNETILAERALQKPLFGWGSSGGARVFDDEGKDISTTDGLWIIVLGQSGLVGLCGLLGTLIVPAIRALRVAPPAHWGRAAYAPAAVIIVLALVHAVDYLLNGMLNPFVWVMGGGLVTLGGLGRRRAPARTSAVAHARPGRASPASVPSPYHRPPPSGRRPPAR